MTNSLQTIQQQPWGLWIRQIAGIIQLEFRKSYLRRRAFWVYFLSAGPPILLSFLVYTVLRGQMPHGFTQFHEIFHVLYLRLIVFFGCLGIFTNLFRGEILEKTWHYYCLAPVSKRVLAAGKFLAGWIMTSLLFSASAVLTFLLIQFVISHTNPAQAWLDSRSLGQLFSYVNVIVFACLGYGAFFSLIGVLFRVTIIPVLLFWGWETVIFLLPPFLKRLSIIFNLNSLTPIPLPLDVGPFAVLATPTPVWLVIPGFLCFTIAILWLTSWLLQRMEINYSTD
jgi:hypothetical protein